MQYRFAIIYETLGIHENAQYISLDNYIKYRPEIIVIVSWLQIDALLTDQLYIVLYIHFSPHIYCLINSSNILFCLWKDYNSRKMKIEEEQ